MTATYVSMQELNRQALSMARDTVAQEFKSSMDLNDEKLSNVTVISYTVHTYIQFINLIR